MSQITRNFTDTEFTRSNTAIKNNINNKLPDEYTDNMMRVLNLLQVIRDSWNAPIIISSGYRCKELNKILMHSSVSFSFWNVLKKS